jgi:hypothetical protein
MTWVAVGVAAVGTAVSVAGQVSASNAQAGAARQQGMAAMSEAALNDQMSQIEARDAERLAAFEADNIKRQAMVMRGSIAVAQSGSGVMIGEGSAQAAMDQLETLSSADALAALYSGVNRAVSARTSGRFGMQAGQNRAKAAGEAEASAKNAAGWAVAGGIAQIGGGLARGYATPSAANPTSKTPSEGAK